MIQNRLRDRKIQKSVTLYKYQHDFLYNYPEFQLNIFIREQLDNQIRMIDPGFLNPSAEDVQLLEKNG